MDIKTMRNYTISKQLGVAHPTVARWVEAALKKENNLQLHQVNNKYYIIDNLHNEAEMLKLKTNAEKYRNKIAFEKLVVSEDLKDILNESQIIELITSLENNGSIPLKFAYLNGGAKLWDEYVKSMINNKDYHLDETNSLLETSLNYFAFRLKDYEQVNIIDIGPGNGYTIKPLIDILQTQAKINYTSIDLSKEIQNILTKNMLEWYPNIEVNNIVADIEQILIRDLLFNNKLKNPNSCNVLLFIGSTLGNVANRQQVLKNLNNSMGADDILILDNGLDTPEWRSSFATANNPYVTSLKLWIPQLLGFTTDMYEIVSKYDENSGRRLQVLKLVKDIDLEFNLEWGIKILSFKENEEIIIWNHYSHTLKSFIGEMNESNFAVTHMSCYPDLSYILALCQVVK
jgi:uncharacterized SAM-dependent methyltransferase